LPDEQLQDLVATAENLREAGLITPNLSTIDKLRKVIGERPLLAVILGVSAGLSVGALVPLATGISTGGSRVSEVSTVEGVKGIDPSLFREAIEKVLISDTFDTNALSATWVQSPLISNSFWDSTHKGNDLSFDPAATTFSSSRDVFIEYNRYVPPQIVMSHLQDNLTEVVEALHENGAYEATVQLETDYVQGSSTYAYETTYFPEREHGLGLFDKDVDISVQFRLTVEGTSDLAIFVFRAVTDVVPDVGIPSAKTEISFPLDSLRGYVDDVE
jgi:hypothetical protein